MSTSAPLDAAIARAHELLWKTQDEATGALPIPCDLGPAATAEVLIALHFVGRRRDDRAIAVARWLSGQQRADGSFVAYPFARTGDLGATATVAAALRLVGRPEDSAVIERASAHVAANGGVGAVCEKLLHGDVSAIFLGLVGEIDASDLPEPPLAFALVPGWFDLVKSRLNPGVPMMAMCIGAVVRFLRGEWGSHGNHEGFLGSTERHHSLDFLRSFQNANGSWNDESQQTALCLAGLYAMGAPATAIEAAADWLESLFLSAGDPLFLPAAGAEGGYYPAYYTHVWTTALAARAFLLSGGRRDDSRLVRAVEFLLASQTKAPPPAAITGPAGAPNVGGWAFQPLNTTMPDYDDTGIVLGALGIALDRSSGDALPDDVAERARQAVERGRDWLVPRQGADGGWAAFSHGLPGKPRGPIMTRALEAPTGLRRALESFIHVPEIMGDPPTEDITGRVLHGLAQIGCSLGSPVVERACDFFRAQQCNDRPENDGAFWGRWMVNYLTGTACVVAALTAVGADLEEPWIQRAIQWMKRRQRADGGWGEGPESYAHPARAGMADTSMPPLTGMVLSALIDAGLADSPEVASGIAYLLERQNADGSWPNGDWLHTYLPPDTFYYYPAGPWIYPLQALGVYARARAGRREPEVAPPSTPPLPSRGPERCWNDAYLESMRLVGDAPADALVTRILAEGEADAVNRLLERMVRNDDPVPAGLPSLAAEYFEQTVELPSWADPSLLLLAQRLFTRVGWATAAALFCSSLPQAYAAAKGTRVLVGTGGMTHNVRRRVLETAQFIFDVADEGAFAPRGGGIRAAQKVRLLHAAIRHLTLQQRSWDLAAGIPINQEDLAGMLMGFSVAIVEAWRRLRLVVSEAEEEAWLHLWNVVGHGLGIHEELLPRDVTDGFALLESVRALEWGPSDQGQLLAEALVSTMKEYVPGRAFDGIPVTLIRELAGDRCADVLGLPKADWTRVLVEAIPFVEEALGGAPRSQLDELFHRFSHSLMKAFISVQREGKQTRFRIPTALLHTWNLED